MDVHHSKDTTQMASWRERAIGAFGLLPLPEEWANDALVALSQSDDASWKRYYEFRQNQSQDEDNEEEEEDCGLPKRVREALAREAAEIGLSSTNNAAGAKMWLKHAQFVGLGDTSWEDYDNLRSATYYGLVFSPFAVPRAMELKHRYHNRMRYASVEYFATWSFKLLRFDGEPGGDTRQVDLAHQFPAGYILSGLPPETAGFDTETGYEELCSDELEDPPDIRADIDDQCWTGVHKTTFAGLTPMTVRRIRGWIFGHVVRSVTVLDDFALMRLLFATCGTASFNTASGDIGHSWPNYRHEREPALVEMRESGVVPNDADNFSISWLEHRVRMICGALRPIDRFYQPQDSLADWVGWG
eukprot:CAMPEP_0185774692 /NCGR_PEP_ID=MMETSP1174-20130828/79391_1 /TAXON_ID=35687 /ORGANISM="Dictyocha speculum, Strain CCMP1381" /LENGTH=357 /DNA_ID=CAMNT_0028462001 /DNA_START=45 /DNA_END=1114 /DNA_ORIENTATION=-